LLKGKSDDIRCPFEGWLAERAWPSAQVQGEAVLKGPRLVAFRYGGDGLMGRLALLDPIVEHPSCELSLTQFSFSSRFTCAGRDDAAKDLKATVRDHHFPFFF
jgi:hypothetical protein